MLELIFQNTAAFVFSANDWEKLRKEYRIVGDVFGNTQFTPTLPVKLNPEEVYLLVNKGFANLVQYEKITEEPSSCDAKYFSELQTDLLQEEQKIYLSMRKEELQQTIGKVVEGKRRKGDNRSAEEIFEDELQKSSTVTKEQMVWPVFTEHPPKLKGKSTHVPLETIFEWTSLEKCKVYSDLWEKGFYITPGQKFGGDFLAYLGDPVSFHAIHILRCVKDPNTTLHPSEIVAFGRLATSVKKNAILASVKPDDSISYITINWMDL